MAFNVSEQELGDHLRDLGADLSLYADGFWPRWAKTGVKNFPYLSLYYSGLHLWRTPDDLEKYRRIELKDVTPELIQECMAGILAAVLKGNVWTEK